MPDALTETLTWIPVSERLPKDRQLTLIVLEETGVAMDTAADYIDRSWYWADTGQTVNYYVTHWAEMPRGPAQEK